MEGVGEVGAPSHPLEPVGTAVREIDRLPGRRDRFRYVAESEVELAEVAVTDGRVLPILRLRVGFGSGPHGRDGIGQPANGAESEPRSEERRVGKECRSRWSP